MKLKIHKQSFVKDILTPISVLSDRAVLSFATDGLSCIVNNTENNVILYLKTFVAGTDEALDLNVGDVKKLIRALDCVDQDQVEFEFTPGYITYETDAVTFKYHLLQSGLIQKHTIDINKINNLKYNTIFSLDAENIQKIIRATSFATETNKLYFYTKDNKVYANLTDYTLSQADNIGFKVADEFQGTPLKTELPLNIETFKLLQTNKSNSITVNINSDLKILLFHIKSELCELKYIVSGLVK